MWIEGDQNKYDNLAQSKKMHFGDAYVSHTGVNFINILQATFLYESVSALAV